MAVSHGAAREIAFSALMHVLQDPELAGGFFGTSGLQPDDVAAMRDDPALDMAVFDYLLEDDTRVLAAADALGLPPRDILAARTLLAGPGSFGWDAD